MENLELKLQSSQAKVIGTIILITGALTVTLYKGQAITILPLPQGNLDSGVLLYQQSNWLFGGFLLALGIFCLSILIVYQVINLSPIFARHLNLLIGNESYEISKGSSAFEIFFQS